MPFGLVTADWMRIHKSYCNMKNYGTHQGNIRKFHAENAVLYQKVLLSSAVCRISGMFQKPKCHVLDSEVRFRGAKISRGGNFVF